MPSKTQKWVRAICRDFYGTEGIHGYGFGQDEDQGQLGAWIVMAGIGLFDVKGLTETDPRFGIGSPLFEKITITLDNKYYTGKEFIIETENNSQENIYLQSLTVNDSSLTDTFIPFSTVVKGGKLKLKMGSSPRDLY
jgi:putative alpha-1,2-mannosidase